MRGTAALQSVRATHELQAPQASASPPTPNLVLPSSPASQLRDLPEDWQREIPNRKRLLQEEH